MARTTAWRGSSTVLFCCLPSQKHCLFVPVRVCACWLADTRVFADEGALANPIVLAGGQAFQLAGEPAAVDRFDPFGDAFNSGSAAAGGAGAGAADMFGMLPFGASKTAPAHVPAVPPAAGPIDLFAVLGLDLTPTPALAARGLPTAADAAAPWDPFDDRGAAMAATDGLDLLFGVGEGLEAPLPGEAAVDAFGMVPFT